MRRNETSQYIAPLHEDKMGRRLQPQREDGWSRFQTFFYSLPGPLPIRLVSEIRRACGARDARTNMARFKVQVADLSTH